MEGLATQVTLHPGRELVEGVIRVEDPESNPLPSDAGPRTV